MQRNIAIIGGGASGMMAAIKAAEAGAQVTIFEHNKLGKKILSTGNGKCNLGNLLMTSECYFSHNMDRLNSCFERFGVNDTIRFFENAGLCLKEKNGYLYPLSEQASVVLQILLNKISNHGIRVVYDEKIDEIKVLSKKKPGKSVMLTTEKKQHFFDAVVLCCGSKAAPKSGSDGSGYDYAKQLGHRLVPVLPSLVQLRCSDKFCKELAGIRAEGIVHIFDGENELCSEKGEIQLTDYGISGIPVFQLSGQLNRYLYNNKNKKLIAKIDFLPNISTEEKRIFCNKRRKLLPDSSVHDFFCGILNQKLMNVCIKIAGLHSDARIKSLTDDKLQEVLQNCYNLEFHICGSNGFENAQVCTGGVDLNEVTDNLESVYAPNVYFAGEILDVDGKCGGYNLQWAWTSGSIAGEAAAIGK